MAEKVDLHNFFKYFDSKNPAHVAAVQYLEDNLPEMFLREDSKWVRIYRQKTEPPMGMLAVPWFPQTDNYIDPDRTCNSSACAMCLEFFKPGTLTGPRGDDAYLKTVLKYGDTTDHTAQTKALKEYGLESYFSYKLTFKDLDSELEKGNPVVLGILHRGTINNPTGGHMIVCRGKTPGGDYIMNDPYGSLNDGYTGPSSNGRSVVYKKLDLERRWVPKSNDGWGRIFLPVKK